MRRNIIAAVMLGGIGCAILISLGIWQMNRLAWKETVLAEIDARIAADPVQLPDAPDSSIHPYLPVRASGHYTPEHIRVLVSVKRQGAGYRIIRPFETVQGRRILVDQGFVPTDVDLPQPSPDDSKEIVGNLHWPDEVDGYTPEPDLGRNIWFARDLPAMAKALKAEETLIVLRSIAGGPSLGAPSPMPVSRAGIPNDHLQYAITWFSLAVIWLGMTLYWLWRMRQRTI